MNTDIVQRVALHPPAPRSTARPALPPSYHELIGPARRAILGARQHLIGRQRRDGSWLGRQTADASLASQLVILRATLGCPAGEFVDQAATTIFDGQLPDGGWSLEPGGSADVSVSVQAYVALRLAGRDPADACLVQARKVIRSLGGADAADTATRFLLALCGLVEYDACPPLLPELCVVRRSRVLSPPGPRILTPLTILYALRPFHSTGLTGGIRELFVAKPCDWQPPCDARAGHRWIARALRKCEAKGWVPFRRLALDRAEAELKCQLAADPIDDLTFTELVWHIFAVHVLGFAQEHPLQAACAKRLRELISIDADADRAWPQPRPLPLTDTALALEALQASGAGLAQIAATSVVSWLADQLRQTKKANRTTDLARLVSLWTRAPSGGSTSSDALPPSIGVGTSRRQRNLDHATRAAKRIERTRRALRPLIAALVDTQNANGGWNDEMHGTTSSAPEVTGAVLTALATYQDSTVQSAVRRGVAYLRAAQAADGRWDCDADFNRVQGTALAIGGLLAAGVDRDDEAIAAGVHALCVYQQPAGGWGETASELAGCPVQTAFAVTALVAAGQACSAATLRGVQYLIDAQQDDGSWPEPLFSLRDPRDGCAIRNDMHAAAWPLVALSRWAVAAAAQQAVEPARPSLRLVGETP